MKPKTLFLEERGNLKQGEVRALFKIKRWYFRQYTQGRTLYDERRVLGSNPAIKTLLHGLRPNNVSNPTCGVWVHYPCVPYKQIQIGIGHGGVYVANIKKSRKELERRINPTTDKVKLRKLNNWRLRHDHDLKWVDCSGSKTPIIGYILKADKFGDNYAQGYWKNGTIYFRLGNCNYIGTK